MNGFAFNLILVFHVLIGLALIVFVLVQHGKGADMGASFGSGASGSLFGASGSANFLSRTTAVLATLFFVTSLTLTWLGKQSGGGEGGKTVYDNISTQSAPAVTPAPAPAPQPQK